MKVLRTSLFVMNVEKALHRRRVQFGRTKYVLRTPRRKMTSGKLSYGPKVGHPLNARSECDVLWTTLALWDVDIPISYPHNAKTQQQKHRQYNPVYTKITFLLWNQMKNVYQRGPGRKIIGVSVSISDNY